MSQNRNYERSMPIAHARNSLGDAYLIKDLLDTPEMDLITSCDQVFLGCDLSRYDLTVYTSTPWDKILKEKTVATPLQSNIDELNRAFSNTTQVRLAHLPLAQIDIAEKRGVLGLEKIYKSIDSRERMFDGNKLMPLPEVPISRPHLEENKRWQSPVPEVPTKSLRYRLGATKRHFLALLISLIGNNRADGVEYGWGEYAHTFGHSEPETIERQGVEQSTEIPLTGTTYSFVTDSLDEESGWNEMLSAFCAAFKDCEDVNLVVYLRGDRRESCAADFNHVLHTLGPLRCNVFLLQGTMTEKEYFQLISETTFFVGTSRRYALQLDLIAFACAGKPTISLPNCMGVQVNKHLITLPIQFSMELSYPDRSNSIKYTTHAFRMKWESLYLQFKKSYQLATDDNAYAELCQQHKLSLDQLICGEHEVDDVSETDTSCAAVQQATNP